MRFCEGIVQKDRVGVRLMGKKFAAIVVVIFVKGVLIIWGTQNVRFIVGIGCSFVKFATVGYTFGRYFWTFYMARKELDSWLSP